MSDEYVFQEFPKWVHPTSGSVIVQDAEEEARVLAIAEPEKRGPGRPRKVIDDDGS